MRNFLTACRRDAFELALAIVTIGFMAFVLVCVFTGY